jgi:hypothetical protein
VWNCEWPWDGIRVNKGEIAVINMSMGGIRLNKGEIVVIKYGCRRDKVE